MLPWLQALTKRQDKQTAKISHLGIIFFFQWGIKEKYNLINEKTTHPQGSETFTKKLVPLTPIVV
jgi:hypothetical protein